MAIARYGKLTKGYTSSAKFNTPQIAYPGPQRVGRGNGPLPPKWQKSSKAGDGNPDKTEPRKE